MRVRDELEEDGAVENHVACRADTVESEHDAEDVEVRTGAGGETKDGADEKGRVPGKPAHEMCQRLSLAAVLLSAYLRPITSAVMPQKRAPGTRPMSERVKIKREREKQKENVSNNASRGLQAGAETHT